MNKRTRWKLTIYVVVFTSIVTIYSLYLGKDYISVAVTALTMLGGVAGIYKVMETKRPS